MEQPKPDTDSDDNPRERKTPGGSSDVRPEAPSKNPKVTPLDEGRKIEQGIELKET